MRTGFKCRAYPTPRQQAILMRTFGCVRLVWNRALAWRQARWREGGTRTSFTEANACLTRLKRDPELAFLSEVSSVPLQQAIRTQQTAFTCPGCGTLHDRDHNAAKNILAAGLAVTACGADVGHAGPPRVRSAAKQEPQPVRAGIPGFSHGEDSQ